MNKEKKKRKKSSTTQIGIRLDNDLLIDVDDICKEYGIDRNTLIRTALAIHITKMDRDDSLQAISDYIAGIIDDKEFLEQTGMDKIADDVKEARKSRLRALSEKGLED